MIILKNIITNASLTKFKRVVPTFNYKALNTKK